MRCRISRLALPLLVLLLAAAPAAAADVRYTVPAGDSPSIGPANAPVTLVEFVDYQ
jgi:protein-disulfide isomerase